MEGVPLMDRAGLAEKACLEDRHWWFRGRRRMIAAELARVDLPTPCAVLDAGCGSGRMLDELGALDPAIGVDVNPEAVEAARDRGHEAVQADIDELPFRDESFDLILCLDVLEHVEDDLAALRELSRVARPGATMLLSVPAWPLLWSSHDAAAAHRRRYRRRELAGLASDSGWQVARDGYFNCFLLPFAALSRLGDRALRSRRAHRSHLRLTPAWLDRPLELPLRVEAGLVRRGVRLPAGLSLVAALRRPSELS